MGSRTAVRSGPRTRSTPRIVGAVLAVGLALLMIKWVLTTVLLLAVPFGIWWLADRATLTRRVRREAEDTAARAARRRTEVESRAVVDAAGGCGWCGSRVAHRDVAGRLVMPRAYHRNDIEQTLAVA